MQPIVESRNVLEFFVRGDKVVATWDKGRCEVFFQPPLKSGELEQAIDRVTVEAALRLSLRNPIDSGDLDGWRIQVKIPELSGRVEMHAAKIMKVPDLLELIPPLLAVRLLLASLSTNVLILGPAGSGKTTLLNSLLLKILELYPKLKISVIEFNRELQLPDTPMVSRSVGEDITRLLRYAIRYERPDLLVLGELRGEEVVSWIEATRQGVPSLTTYHSSNLKVAINSLNDIANRERGVVKIQKYIKVFVILRKYICEKVYRKIEEAYISDGELIYPFYLLDRYMPEEIFLKFFNKTIIGNAEDVYRELLEKLKVKNSYKKLTIEPLTL